VQQRKLLATTHVLAGTHRASRSRVEAERQSDSAPMYKDSNLPSMRRLNLSANAAVEQ
jgi:hypothetical protein